MLGQATLDIGRQLHRLAAVLLAFTIIIGGGLGVLGWRLSRAPLDITWLARQVAPNGVEVGEAALAWEGWRKGLDHPLDIRLSRLSAIGAGGATLAVIPQAEVSLSFAWLLVGRVVPRAIEVDGARIRAVRAADGRISTVLGSLTADTSDSDAGPDPFGAVLSEFSRAARTDATASNGTTSVEDSVRWSQLRLVRIANAEAVLTDRQLGLTWRAPSATLLLTRGPMGGVSGHADVTLAVGPQSVTLTAIATLQPDGKTSQLHARFSPLPLAALAEQSPSLAGLRAIDAPVSGTFDLDLGPQFDVTSARLGLRIGAGRVRMGQDTIGLADARLTMSADRSGVVLSDARLALTAPGNAGDLHAGDPAARAGSVAGPVVELHSAITVVPQKPYLGHLSVAVDQVNFAELGQYWPAGISSSARAWLIANITSGTARAARAAFDFTYDSNQGLQITGATGNLRGEDLTVNWLRPVPPLEHLQAQLTLVSPDEILLTTTTGHQVGGDLHTGAGRMRITGLTQKDQAASLDLELAGPLGDAWTLLRQPRLQLLSRHPVELGDPTGQIATRLHLELPLDNNVTADQIVFHTQGQLSNVHLTLAGRSVDQGTLDFDASGDGLKLSGPLQIATIPAQLAVQMDFRPGPPNQVQTRVNLSGDANISQLAAAGIDSYGLLSGRATISATLEERRNGSGQASIHVDLQNTKMQLDPVGWRREAGGSAQGDVHIVLDHDHFVAIDRLNIDGDGISVVGGATVADGQPVILRLERVALGETRASGTISFNRPPSRVINVVLAGPTLDFSGRFDEPSPAKPNAATTPAAKAPSDQGTSGPPWSVDLQFDQVLLARRQRLSGVRVQADDDGQILRRVRLSGKTGIDEPVTLSIERETDGRRLTAEAANAGAVLSAADIARTVVGGKLTVSGRFDDRTSEHRLNGTIGITNFRVRRAPAAAKLLQAMTLYGLVDALQEPGLGVSQMILPFQKTGEKVELSDARAFSPSLGVTAKGRVDLGNNTADLTGTIVPAYFFNTLLGGLPLVGQLFSPEKGGGVFAATYYIKGPLDDPSVGVNPLAVLTPGFLRGLFGIFDGVK